MNSAIWFLDPQNNSPNTKIISYDVPTKTENIMMGYPGEIKVLEIHIKLSDSCLNVFSPLKTLFRCFSVCTVLRLFVQYRSWFDYTETELDLEPVWFTRFTLLSSKFHWNRIQAAVTIQAFVTCWDTSHWRDKLITRRTSKHHPGKHFFLSTSNDLTTNA